jgi:hypothetical protein
MNKIIVSLLVFWVLMTAFDAYAQEKNDISIFGGYSYIVYPKLSGCRGWNASLASNVKKHLALAADLSGQYQSRNSANGLSRGKYRDFSFLFGPRYVHSIRNRVTPYAQILFGLHHRSDQGTDTLWGMTYRYMNSLNAFAVAIGGGIDVRVNDRFSVRVLQLDGIMMRNNRFFLGWDGYGRASFGAVFHLNKSP